MSSDRRKALGQAFSLGMRFDGGVGRGRNPRDPDATSYLTRLIELYNAHADLLLEGRFVDNEGFSLRQQPGFLHAFVAGNRMAVTLWNPTEVAQKARVVADGYQLEAARWQDPGWSGLDHWIMPGDVAVLVYRRP